MESDYPIPLVLMAELNFLFHPPTYGVIIGIIVLILLLICSGLISGSEVAFFSLSPSDLDKVQNTKSNKVDKLLSLHKRPEQLLGTILVVNNLVNVGIVILSSYITNSLIDFSQAKVLGFIIQIVLITFILLLFGEIIPKIYANQYAIQFSLRMAPAIFFLEKVFYPLVAVMVSSTSFVNKRLSNKKAAISMDQLSDALELSATEIAEDEHILKGIVKFGNIDVQEIMKSRIDVFAIDIGTSFSDLINLIMESGYSRIPVYSESFDHIKGILYIKDLLPHLHKNVNFKWQSLIRPPYFVPESKKINDLLQEFQKKKIHMAIVIDEYGGTSGVVTLEDILEEIVGEITDEFDEDESFFTKIDENTYLFEGKTLLNDFFKVVKTPNDIFDEIKGDADTLAGIILEMSGEIPDQNATFHFDDITFTIHSVDKRRIKKIKVKVNPGNDDSK